MSQSVTESGLWQAVLRELRQTYPADLFEMWFAPLQEASCASGRLVLRAQNAFAAVWIEENYLDMISQRLGLRAGGPMEVVIEAPAEDLPAPRAEVAEGPETNRGGSAKSPRIETVAKARTTGLNPRNTFDNFIIGPSNQLAHAASVAVAGSPGNSYNPLFMFGETGLGKTHLMHAIAQAVMAHNPAAKVVYLSCEKFTNEFLAAIHDNTLTRFRAKYRNVDVLLIDDIQFLAGKERTQEEFFHTFNELFESQRQIVLTSDRPAGEIAQLEGRLVSRFQWGLMADIQPPDLETRVAILQKKAVAHNCRLSPEILQYLASRITRNVRRMEGALTRVASFTTLTKVPMTLDAIDRLLQDILQEEALLQITIERIQRTVCEYFELRLQDMSSKRRPANIALPRQIAMYLARLHTNLSLQDIGDAFGGRDHGTVIHACKTIEIRLDQDESVRRAVDYLTKTLQKPIR